MSAAGELVHATCLALGGDAVLVRGAPGAGKSDLALRCIGAGPLALLPDRPCRLVSDDQVVLQRTGDTLLASPPPSIAGLIEVRGLGLVRVPHLAAARVMLVADLVPAATIERMPEDDRVVLAGVALPLLRLAPFEASAPVKLLIALATAAGALERRDGAQ
ncbi:MAG: HPr kinase/phosphorylase [Hyphomicrobiaceae bacterium]